MDKLIFSKNLIKGRVAEMIFEQMLRDAGGFTVLGFGYEKIIPELARRQDTIEAERTMEIIRRAPDFAVIKHENNKVYLVEVKYMHNMTREKVLVAANKMINSWDPSYLFVVTPHSFFFESVRSVVEKEGEIEAFGYDAVSKNLQDEYLKLLNTFID
jgi:hypothetical protein